MNSKHPVESEELQAYLDNELARERRLTIEQHLAACVDCRRVLDDLRAVSARLQAWQVEPAPTYLKPPAFEAGTERRVRIRPRLTWRWVAAFGGAAAAVLLIVAVSIPNLLRSHKAVVIPTEVGHLEAPPSPPPSLPPPAAVGKKENRRAPALPPASDMAPGIAPLRSAEKAAESKDELGEMDRMAQYAAEAGRGREGSLAVAKSAVAQQMIAQEVSLTLMVKDFDRAKRELLAAVEQAGGYIANAASAETPDQPRRADLVVRVPVAQLNAVLEAARGLGRVTYEQQSGEEVTAQYVDLQARLKNARTTEERLVRVLAERTGKVRDILEVEREIARVRQEIERMEAQRKHLENRVAQATLSMALVEEFEAKLAPTPVGTGTQLKNALVEGIQNFVGMLVSVALFFARYGLNLLFWGGLGWLGWRAIWLRLRPRLWPAV